MRNTHAPTTTDLRLALRAAIARAAPELVNALDWLESTDPHRDLDDHKLAKANAARVLWEAESEDEPDWGTVEPIDWAEIDRRDADELDREMSDGHPMPVWMRES